LGASLRQLEAALHTETAYDPRFSKKSPLVASGGRILLDAHLARA
jgi:hypothetical protein